jgi:O-methyltransferase involved in polyketide biosynthesis
MYLTESQVRDLLHTLHHLGAPGSELAVNFGLGTEAARAPGSRAGAAAVFHRVALALGGEHITYRPSPEQATGILTATGWRPGRTHTAPELVQRYAAGTVLPSTGIRPTAFAMTATTG